uniref:NADH-ubiquinone oxidoreductase chain 4 n=1 Tax=Damon diadema TaxID=317680 RepID=B5U6K7_9ARAC|nr:NADH dehydrogenase subunit 4 [Damon diadema]ACI02275.1 NADH dehydrogenase subunit 4 [Damon diadema]
MVFSLLLLFVCVCEGWLVAFWLALMGLYLLFQVSGVEGGVVSFSWVLGRGFDENFFCYFENMAIDVNNYSWGSGSVNVWSRGEYIFLVVSLGVLLGLSFLSLDFLYFYIFFEGALIPIFIMIIGYGYQPDRLMAGLYMFFYTLSASLPLLLGIMMLGLWWGKLSFSILWLGGYGGVGGWSVILVVAFLVSLPMFFVHLWLPKAHVEAPIGGFMILAGVLLSLGGYGVFWVAGLILGEVLLWGGYLMGICLGGGIMIGFICFGQVDLSSLIAYFSVGHMGLVLIGFCSMSFVGFQGGLLLMVSHGLCSSGLFCLASMVYERVGSRSMMIVRGMLCLMPGLGLWWFLMSIGNMAAPPSLGFFAEVLVMGCLVQYVWWGMFMLAFVMFLVGGYSLWMFSSVNHGGGWELSGEGLGVSVREYLIILCHWVPFNIFGFEVSFIFFVGFLAQMV